MKPADYPGNLFVVAAPSGAGKSSLVKALLELDSHLAVSISHTTRAPRGQEQDGREYHFIGEPEFRAKIAAGDFFEWAEVHGNLYGTSRVGVEASLARGDDQRVDERVFIGRVDAQLRFRFGERDRLAGGVGDTGDGHLISSARAATPTPA